MSDQEMAEHVRTFLDLTEAPEVLADHPNDFTLLRRVLAQASAPVDWMPVLVDQSEVRSYLEATSIAIRTDGDSGITPRSTLRRCGGRSPASTKATADVLIPPHRMGDR